MLPAGEVAGRYAVGMKALPCFCPPWELFVCFLKKKNGLMFQLLNKIK